MEIIDIRCPKCKGNLILDDEYNDGTFYEDTYIDYSTCYCEKCDTNFFIKTYYKFSHFELGEEIKE